MYVRWKKRMRSKYHRSTGEGVLTAVLVKSERVNGTPCQHFVSYLGTIQERGISHYYHHLDFWDSATKHLDALQLNVEVRNQIETSLEAVVSKPDASGRAQLAAKLQ